MSHKITSMRVTTALWFFFCFNKSVSRFINHVINYLWGLCFSCVWDMSLILWIVDQKKNAASVDFMESCLAKLYWWHDRILCDNFDRLRSKISNILDSNQPWGTMVQTFAVLKINDTHLHNPRTFSASLDHASVPQCTGPPWFWNVSVYLQSNCSLIAATQREKLPFKFRTLEK